MATPDITLPTGAPGSVADTQNPTVGTNAQAPASSDWSPDNDQFFKGLSQSPVIQAVKDGKVPAIYAPPTIFGDKTAQVLPSLQKGIEHLKLGFVQAPASGVLVVYNPKSYTEKEILSADSQGTLDQIAVNVGGSSQPGAPADAAGASQQAPASPDQAQPPSSILSGLQGSSALPKSSQTDLTKARIGQLTPKPPVKVPSPSSQVLSGLTSRAF